MRTTPSLPKNNLIVTRKNTCKVFISYYIYAHGRRGAGQHQGMTMYMVYLQAGGEAFFNPAPSNYGNPDPQIGSAVNDCTVIARGSQAQAQAVVSAINATLPALSFGDLMDEQE